MKALRPTHVRIVFLRIEGIMCSGGEARDMAEDEPDLQVFTDPKASA